MRKLLNTLYITNPEAYIYKDGLNIVVSVEQVEAFRIPIINIEEIVSFGYRGVSPGAMKLCVDNNVGLSFLSPNGQFLARVQGPTRGNVLLRTLQYKLQADEALSLHLSQLFVAGKIQNYRAILCRAIRDNGPNDEIEAAASKLDYCKRKAMKAQSMELLRGIEGEAANGYFGVFRHLILKLGGDFVFNGRNRRPPKDPVNVLLSFVYTLISNMTVSALETIGLDPYVGFMHTLRPGRPSLALDVMEEFRAYLGDRLVLSMINRGQITIKDFVLQGEDMTLLSDEGRKKVITIWQERKKDMITHPFLQEKMPIGLLPYVQAQLLARYLRGDLDDYPVFLIK